MIKFIKSNILLVSFCFFLTLILAVLIIKFPVVSQKFIQLLILKTQKNPVKRFSENDLINQVLPKNGVKIPIILSDLGQRMISEGVIDQDKLKKLYKSRQQPEKLELFLNKNDSNIVINQNNANNLLNFFWALGLSNNNDILEKGPMVQNGKTDNYASTGGWTLAKGNVMDHYSKHEYLKLTSNQQNMVEKISKNIYRPCCGNSTYFPDCNHGMAMLGFLELMASRNFGEKEIYKNALALNSFWFPNDYLTIGQYLKENGQNWNKVDPKIVLGKNYSSGDGIATVRSKVKNLPSVVGNGSCGV